MRKIITKLAILTLLLFFVSACGSEGNNEAEGTKKENDVIAKKEVLEKLPSVCIWDKGTIREQPEKKGKFVSSMSLGETITWLGKTEVDSSDKNKTYYNVVLSDGTEGWASEYVIAPNAKPAIATKEVPIYKRPDLLTITEKSFDEMDLVAVTKENNEWVEVVGKERKKTGWIKSRLISYKSEDVAFGLLATKALALKDSVKRYARISELVENPSFANSRFLRDLKEQVKQEKLNQDFLSLDK